MDNGASPYKKLIRNSAIFAIGSFGSKVLVFLLTPLYAHTMSPEELGISDAIFAGCTIILYIVSLEIYEATMRFCKSPEIPKEDIIKNCCIVWIGSSVVMMVVSAVLFKIPLFSPYVFYVFFVVVAQDLFMILTQYIRGSEILNLYAIFGICQSAILLISSYVLLKIYDMGVRGYLLAYTLSYLVPSIILTAVISIPNQIKKGRYRPDLIRKMLRYSIPLIMTGLSWWVLNASDKYVIIYYLGNSANGIYSISQKIPMVITAINTIFNSAWQLSAIDEASSDNSETFYNNVFQMYSTVLFIVSGSIIIWGQFVLSLLSTRDYEESLNYLPILVLSSLFHVFGNFLGGLNVAYKKTHNLIYSAIVAAILNLLLNILLTPKLGMYGTSIATCLGCLCMIILRVWDAFKNLGIAFDLKNTILAMLILVLQIVLGYTDIPYSKMLQVLFLGVLVIIYRKYILIIIQKISSHVGSHI